MTDQLIPTTEVAVDENHVIAERRQKLKAIRELAKAKHADDLALKKRMARVLTDFDTCFSAGRVRPLQDAIPSRPEIRSETPAYCSTFDRMSRAAFPAC